MKSWIERKYEGESCVKMIITRPVFPLRFALFALFALFAVRRCVATARRWISGPSRQRLCRGPLSFPRLSFGFRTVRFHVPKLAAIVALNLGEENFGKNDSWVFQ